MTRTTRTRTKKPRWQDTFLAELTEHGNISKACRRAGVGRSTAYDERRRDAEFDRLWFEAEEVGTDAIQERVRKEAARADGDARLAIFWLKTRRSQLFGERLREDEVREIQQTARKATIAELTADIRQLPEQARDIITVALARMRDAERDAALPRVTDARWLRGR